MTTLPAPPSRPASGGSPDAELPAPRAERAGRTAPLSPLRLLVRRSLPWAVGGVIALGVLLRLFSASGLWLDEALSVAIASVPLSELPEALRRDGSPPLYYALLHVWMKVFGDSDLAVRALSAVFAVAALPLIWLAGLRLDGRRTAWAGLLLLATSPFAVRYATETRMYAMVMFLVLAGILALEAARRRPDLPRLALLALLSGALLLTHYWAFFLLGATGLVLLERALLTGNDKRSAWRLALAVAAGGLALVPWLPVFLFQTKRTGTPWAGVPSMSSVLQTFEVWSGGGTTAGGILTLLVLGLAILALVGQPWSEGGRSGVVLRLPVNRTGRDLALVAVGTLVLGLGAANVLSAGYAARYSSVALPPALLLAAMGARALPGRGRVVALTAAVALGLIGTTSLPLSERRTQAPQLAAALQERIRPGDAVVYCPDQLGPAMHRLLPKDLPQFVYPTMGSAERVDWVDYAQRNKAGSPRKFAAAIADRTPGAIFLVHADGYRTYGSQCQQLETQLTAIRGGRLSVQKASTRYFERAALVRIAAP